MNLTFVILSGAPRSGAKSKDLRLLLSPRSDALNYRHNRKENQ